MMFNRIIRTESLEARCLLAVTAAFDPGSGTASIEINGLTDDLTITDEDGRVRINGSDLEGVNSAELRSIHVGLPGSFEEEYLGRIRVGEFSPKLTVVEISKSHDSRLLLGPSALLEIAGQTELRLSQPPGFISNGATLVAAGPITINSQYFTCQGGRVTSGSELVVRADGVVTKDGKVLDRLPSPCVLVAEHATISMFHGPAELTTDVKSIDVRCDCLVTVVNLGDVELQGGFTHFSFQTLRTENENGDLRITGSISDPLGRASRRFEAAGSLEVTSALSSSGGWKGDFLFGSDFHLTHEGDFGLSTVVVESTAEDTPSEILLLGSLAGPTDVRGGGGDDRIVWNPRQVNNDSEQTVITARLNGGDGNDLYEVHWTDGVEIEISDAGAIHEDDELIFDARGEFVVDTGSEIIGQYKTCVSYRGIESVTIIGNPLEADPTFPRGGDFNSDGSTNSLDIDRLFAAIREDVFGWGYDLNVDNIIDDRDVMELVEGILETRRGDLNLDGKVDQDDYSRLAASFGESRSQWNRGDVTGDGSVTFADFLLLSADFGFGQ